MSRGILFGMSRAHLTFPHIVLLMPHHLIISLSPFFFEKNYNAATVWLMPPLLAALLNLFALLES